MLAIDAVLLYVLYTDFFLWYSKGVLLSPAFYLPQIFLILIIIAFCCVHCVRKDRRLKRIKMHYKVAILTDILEPKTPTASALIRLGEIISKSFYGSPSRSAKDSFLESVKAQQLNKDDALNYLDEFIDEYLIADCRLSISVSKREHRINCKKWKELRRKFTVPSQQ